MPKGKGTDGHERIGGQVQCMEPLLRMVVDADVKRPEMPDTVHDLVPNGPKADEHTRHGRQKQQHGFTSMGFDGAVGGSGFWPKTRRTSPRQKANTNSEYSVVHTR